jgi:hypothetical protein
MHFPCLSVPIGNGRSPAHAKKSPKLLQAAARVAEARRIIAQQYALIAQLKASMHPTDDAERSLRMYIRLFQPLEDHERKLRKESKPSYGQKEPPAED